MADARPQATPAHTPDYQRCEPCLGMGYKGRWRTRAAGRKWCVEACRSCGGTGSKRVTVARGGAR